MLSPVNDDIDGLSEILESRFGRSESILRCRDVSAKLLSSGTGLIANSSQTIIESVDIDLAVSHVTVSLIGLSIEFTDARL